MIETSLRTDVAVVGAGPVGLFAVFQCGMLRLNCVVVDALEAAGGQCVALYPEKPIYDIPGFPSLPAGKLVERLLRQIQPFAATMRLGQRATTVEQTPEGRWLLTTDKGTRIDCAAVILAVGAGAFGPNRPPLAGIDAYEGRSVFYFVSRRETFRDKKVVVAGGGDSAVDWALSLSEIAAAVHLVHRRPRFRCSPESAERLQQQAALGKIRLSTPWQLSGLRGNNGLLDAVEIQTLDGSKQWLEADALLPFFGLATDLGPIADWGLEMERSAIRVNPTTGATNRAGIFAAGDVAAYPHKLKLILTGFAEAAQAAHAAFSFARPGEALHFAHSTSSGIPR